MAQIIKIKGSKTNASATPSSLVERELASNLVDRCLFGSDGTSVFKYYTGATKYFDANGYANNANKLGGQTIDYFASADGVADALDEIIATLKGYQPLITSSNKLAYSLISGVPTKLSQFTNDLGLGTFAYKSSLAFADLTGKPTTLSGYGITDAYTKSQVDSALGGYVTLSTDQTITGIKTYSNTIEIINGNSITDEHGNGVLGLFPTNWSGVPTNSAIALGTLVSPLYFRTNADNMYHYRVDKDAVYKVLDSSNYSEYALPLSGGTLTGAILIGAYTSFGVSGDNFYLGSPSYPLLIRSNGDAKVNGNTIIHTGNIGSQSVASAAKLTTARSIWGQSFDGTGNVSGGVLNANYIKSNDTNGYFVGNRTDGVGATDGGLMLYTYGYTPMSFYTNGAEYMRISQDGNVLIGTTTDNGYKLEVNGTLGMRGHLYLTGAMPNSSTANTSQIVLGTPSDQHIAISSNMDALVLNPNISSTTNQIVLYLNSQSLFPSGISSGAISCSSTIYAATGIWSDGYVSAKGQNTSSDMRLKNVLNDVVLNVSDIANAPSVRFSWKNGGGIDVGSSAQYWQGLLPDAVKEMDKHLEMQYGNIALLSAIAIARNMGTMEEDMGTMKQELDNLKKENKELKNRIDILERGIA